MVENTVENDGDPLLFCLRRIFQEVNDFCKGMPRYKRPRKIIFADVPRNPTGKIEKPKLRELYAGANLVEQQTRK